MVREYAQPRVWHGGNPYPSWTYARAADSLATLGEPMELIT